MATKRRVVTCHFIRNAFLIIGLLSITIARLLTFNARVIGPTRPSTITEKKSSDDFTFEETNGHPLNATAWAGLKDVLCGNGYPNLVLSRMLFDLARTEAFTANTSILSSEIMETFRPVSGRPSRTMVNFFVGDFGTSFFHGTNKQGKNFATLYVKLWKCGNNQIRWMEKKAFKHYNGTYVGKEDKLSLKEALTERVYLFNSTDGTYSYRFDKTTPPPCIYTAVRDPISHFLSGYNEIEVRQLGEYNNGSSSDFPFLERRAPYHLDVPYSNNSSDLRKQRFTAFVRDVLLENDVFSSHHVYSHFFSMSRILSLLARYDQKLTGYIPSLDNITSAWPSFISSSCPNAPPLDEFPTMTKQGQHRSSRDRLGLYQAAKDVWQEAGPIAKALCLIHAFDYACYEDLPDGIPTICQEMFQTYSEQLVEYGSIHAFNISSTSQR